MWWLNEERAEAKRGGNLTIGRRDDSFVRSRPTAPEEKTKDDTDVEHETPFSHITQESKTRGPKPRPSLHTTNINSGHNDGILAAPHPPVAQSE